MSSPVNLPMPVYAKPSGYAKPHVGSRAKFHQLKADTVEIRFGATRDEVEQQFINAAKTGNKGALLGFLKAGKINLNLQNKNGDTAAIRAAFNGHTEVLQALIAAGANLNLQNKNGDTAAIRAAFNGHTEVLQALIAAKANLNLQNKNGDTAAIMAAHNGHTEALKLFTPPGLSPQEAAEYWKAFSMDISD